MGKTPSGSHRAAENLPTPSTACSSLASSFEPSLATIRGSLREARALLETTDHAMTEFIQVHQMNSVQHLALQLGHDFRNSLIAIAALIHQLEKAMPIAEVQSKAESIRQVLRRMETLVTHLHSIGSDGHDEEMFAQDLSGEARRVAEMMRASLEPAIELIVQACCRPLPVIVSGTDLWRILSNLLLNARDAMPAGGRLIVATEGREVDAGYCSAHGNARTGHFGVLSVRDQGVGILPDILPRIFDPLFSTKSSTGGEKRGWGLAIVYTLVSRRGGWIDVESVAGAGTRFEIFLPLSRPVLNHSTC